MVTGKHKKIKSPLSLSPPSSSLFLFSQHTTGRKWQKGHSNDLNKKYFLKLIWLDQVLVVARRL